MGRSSAGRLAAEQGGERLYRQRLLSRKTCRRSEQIRTCRAKPEGKDEASAYAARASLFWRETLTENTDNDES